MTGAALRVAAVQFAVGTDVDANLATARRLIDDAARERAELVVTPEFVNHVSVYDSAEHCWDVAVDLDGPFVAGLGDRARTHGVWLVANCTVRRRRGVVTITNILFDHHGQVAATSDKQTLMGAERQYLSGAETPGPVVLTPFGRLGMYSCMDGVVNETAHDLALRGAQVLCNSLNSFARDEGAFHVPARAAENRVWIVAACKIGWLLPPEKREQFAAMTGVPVDAFRGAGESQIVAPDGSVVAQGPPDREAVVVVTIDVSAADDKTRPDGTDVFESRRPECYGALTTEPPELPPPSGAAELEVAAVQPEPGEDLPATVASLAHRGAQLVVLPELAVEAAQLDSLQAALAGTPTVVVASFREAVGSGGAHTAVALDADGVRLRQRQMHRSARFAPWQTELADAVAVEQFPWGRLAILPGDDFLYPEVGRLAVLRGAEVLAIPGAVLEPADARLTIPQRAAENRCCVVAAARPTHDGASVVVDTPAYPVWSDPNRPAPFDGTINDPPRVPGPPRAGILEATVHPERAAEKLISSGTDLVRGRPWRLTGAISAPLHSIHPWSESAPASPR